MISSITELIQRPTFFFFFFFFLYSCNSLSKPKKNSNTQFPTRLPSPHIQKSPYPLKTKCLPILCSCWGSMRKRNPSDVRTSKEFECNQGRHWSNRPGWCLLSNKRPCHCKNQSEALERIRFQEGPQVPQRKQYQCSTLLLDRCCSHHRVRWIRIEERCWPETPRSWRKR